MTTTFGNALPKFLRDGRFADFTVKCKDKTWNAHRVILSANSEYFDTLSDSAFKAALREAGEKSVTLEDDSDFDVGLMMEFFYTDGYSHHIPTADGSGNQPSNELELHFRMCTIGDKYLCKDLVEYSISEFEACFKRRLEEAAKAYETDDGKTHSILVHDMFDLVPKIYEYDSHDLESSFLGCFTNAPDHRPSHLEIDFTDPVVYNTIQENRVFAVELLARMHLMFK